MSHVQQTLCMHASFNPFTLMDLLSLFYGCTTLGGISPCLSNNDNNAHDDPIYQKTGRTQVISKKRYLSLPYKQRQQSQ